MEAPLAVAAALDAVASITPGGMPLEVAGLLALVSEVQVLRHRLDGLVNDVLVAVARVDDDGVRAEFPQEEFGLRWAGRVAFAGAGAGRAVSRGECACRGEPGGDGGGLALRVLTGVHFADDGVTGFADGVGVKRPRPRLAGGAVVGVVTGCSAW